MNSFCNEKNEEDARSIRSTSVANSLRRRDIDSDREEEEEEEAEGEGVDDGGGISRYVGEERGGEEDGVGTDWGIGDGDDWEGWGKRERGKDNEEEEEEEVEGREEVEDRLASWWCGVGILEFDNDEDGLRDNDDDE